MLQQTNFSWSEHQNFHLRLAGTHEPTLRCLLRAVLFETLNCAATSCRYTPTMRTSMISANLFNGKEAIRRKESFYGSNQNLIVTVTFDATGFPPCVAGAYSYCLSASIATCRNCFGPNRIFIAPMCP